MSGNASKGGIFKGKSHKEGGIPLVVNGSGQHIEVEGDEPLITVEALRDNTIRSYEGTNFQILSQINESVGAKAISKKATEVHAGDVIICKKTLQDKTIKFLTGTNKQIVSAINADAGCKVIESGAKMKKNGVVQQFSKGGEAPKVYSKKELEARSQKKKDSIQKLARNVKKLRNKVNEDLKSENEKDFLTALAIYTMLETSERVGNGVSADNGHYGVTGFKKKHLKINDGSVRLVYKGKSGVEHDKVINNKKLATLFNKAIKNSPNDCVFTTSDGFTVKSDKINRYLRGFDVTAKDIRGYSANKWMVSKLTRLTPEEDEKKRKKQFNKVAKEVAQKVGHGASTLKKHYMLPEIMEVWLDKGEVVDLSKFQDMFKGGGETVKKGKTKKMKKGGELERGIEVEKEHKDLYEELKKRLKSKNIPMIIGEEEFYQKIAEAHLKESPDYYKLLDKMEKDAGIKHKEGGQTKKRFFAEADFYVYANSAEEAEKEARKITNEIDEKYDNQANVIHLHEQPRGVLGSKKIFDKGGQTLKHKRIMNDKNIMAMGGQTAPAKFRQVMREFSNKELTHGTTGETVTDRDMALAIAYSEARKVEPNYGMYEGGGEVEGGYDFFKIVYFVNDKPVEEEFDYYSDAADALKKHREKGHKARLEGWKGDEFDMISYLQLYNVGDKVKMFEDEPELTVTEVNTWSDKHPTYDLKSDDGSINRKNISQTKILSHYADGGELPKVKYNTEPNNIDELIKAIDYIEENMSKVGGKDSSYKNHVFGVQHHYFDNVISYNPTLLMQFLLVINKKLKKSDRFSFYTLLQRDLQDVATERFFNNLKDPLWKLIPPEFKNIPRVRQIHFQATPNNDGLTKIMEGYVTKDDLRPALMGVYFDLENKKVVATDAHRMLLLNSSPEVSGNEICLMGKNQKKTLDDWKKILSEQGGADSKRIINEKLSKFKKSEEGCLEVDGNFPNYLAVIPREYTSVATVKTYNLYKFCMVVVDHKLNNPATRGIRLKYGEFQIGFNAVFLAELLKTMSVLGYSEVELCFQESNRAMVVVPKGNVRKIGLGNNIDTDLGLLMPINLDVDSPYNTEVYSWVYDLEKNCIENHDLEKLGCVNISDNKVVDEKPTLTVGDFVANKKKPEEVFVVDAITPDNKKIDLINIYTLEIKQKTSPDLYKPIDISEKTRFESIFNRSKRKSEVSVLRQDYPIVLELAESKIAAPKGYLNIEELEEDLNTLDVKGLAKDTYMKHKIWVEGYPSDIVVYVGQSKEDYQPNKQTLLSWLETQDKDFAFHNHSEVYAQEIVAKNKEMQERVAALSAERDEAVAALEVLLPFVKGDEAKEIKARITVLKKAGKPEKTKKMADGGEVRRMNLHDAVIYKDKTHYITERDGVVGLENMSQGAWGSDYPFTPLTQIIQDEELTDMMGRKVFIPYSFEEGGQTPVELKGYRVDFYKNPDYNSPQNIVSDGQFSSMVLVTDGKSGDSSVVMSNEPYLKLGQVKFMDKTSTHVKPVNVEDEAWKMFGGNFVWSNDSRFRREVSELPLPLHDRVEKYGNGGKVKDLKVGDLTEWGFIEDVSENQYFIRDRWWDKETIREITDPKEKAEKKYLKSKGYDRLVSMLVFYPKSNDGIELVMGEGDKKHAVAYFVGYQEDDLLVIDKTLLDEIAATYNKVHGTVKLYTNAGVDIHSSAKGKYKNLEIIKVPSSQIKFAEGGEVKQVFKTYKKLSVDNSKLNALSPANKKKAKDWLKKEQKYDGILLDTSGQRLIDKYGIGISTAKSKGNRNSYLIKVDTNGRGWGGETTYYDIPSYIYEVIKTEEVKEVDWDETFIENLNNRDARDFLTNIPMDELVEEWGHPKEWSNNELEEALDDFEWMHEEVPSKKYNRPAFDRWLTKFKNLIAEEYDKVFENGGESTKKNTLVTIKSIDEARDLFNKGYFIYIKDGDGELETNKNVYAVSKGAVDGSLNIARNLMKDGEWDFDTIVDFIKNKTDYPIKFYTLNEKESNVFEGGKAVFATGGEVSDYSYRVIYDCHIGGERPSDAIVKREVDNLIKDTGMSSGELMDLCQFDESHYVYEDGGELKKGTHVVVTIAPDGYWVVSSVPTTKYKAEKFAKDFVPVKGEEVAVKTLNKVKKHKQVMGREYLETGGKLRAKRRTKAEMAQAKYEAEVDAYNWYVVDPKTKKVLTGFESKEDANEARKDMDLDENDKDTKEHKVVSKRGLKAMGIENPNEEWKKMAEGGSLDMAVGDLTNLGVIDDVTETQYYINGTWFHKSLVKPSEELIKPKRNIPTQIDPNLVVSAFENEMDWNKVNDYTDKMTADMMQHEFPPIKGFPSEITDEDVGGVWMNGDEITSDDVGKKIWKVTDGHHRTIAAINSALPYIETELDYATITDEAELELYN